MKNKFSIIAILIWCSAFTFVQKKDIDGPWTGAIKSPDGNVLPLNFTFKADIDKLTGSAQGTRKQYPISDGKIVGDSIYFAITVDNGSQIVNAGKYYSAGDSISLKFTFMGIESYTTLKRDLGGN